MKEFLLLLRNIVICAILGFGFAAVVVALSKALPKMTPVFVIMAMFGACALMNKYSDGYGHFVIKGRKF